MISKISETLIKTFISSSFWGAKPKVDAVLRLRRGLRRGLREQARRARRGRPRGRQRAEVGQGQAFPARGLRAPRSRRGGA